jgi:tetratricopeptide (TPR) repeat protein
MRDQEIADMQRWAASQTPRHPLSLRSRDIPPEAAALPEDKRGALGRLLKAAEDLVAQGLYKLAINRYIDALDIVHWAGGFCARGQVRILFGRPKPARRDAEKALELDPNCAEAHAILAKAWLLRGNPASAIESATKAVELDPRDPELRQVRAQAFEAVGEHDAARAEERKAMLFRSWR